MKVGVVREIKVHENRIALTPAGADRLVAAGHEVFVEAGGGAGSGLPDSAYVTAGARLLPSAAEVWAKSDMIMKVKEPLPTEWPARRTVRVARRFTAGMRSALKAA